MKKYIEINNNDELILIDNNENKTKYSIKFINGEIKVKKENKKYNEFVSINEINLNTLNCISSLNNFIINSETEDIPSDMLSNFNNLHDFMYNKINDKNKISYEKLIDTKYYRVSYYSK